EVAYVPKNGKPPNDRWSGCMNETEFRHQLFDLAEDAPSGSSAPPALLRRARRRVVLTIASSVAIGVLVVGMGIAGVRALQAGPTPPDRPHPTTRPRALVFPRVRGGRRHLPGRPGWCERGPDRGRPSRQRLRRDRRILG